MSNTRESLLFLCHRIPYPPNKGDKIRSWNLLKRLSKHYRIFLATFVDSEEDWSYTEQVNSVCEDCFFVPLNPGLARVKSLKGILTGKALTLPYYLDQRIATWVKNRVSANGINLAVVYSSAMAQYLLDSRVVPVKKIIDFVDVDSDKWRQYAEKKPWPMNLIYRREAVKLLEFDRRVAREFDQGFFVSSLEAEMFKSLAPESSNKVSFYPNGLDAIFFKPDSDFVNPYSSDVLPLVFTGAMDYWPNIDAVCWFTREVFPSLKKYHPKLQFTIVGSNPGREVRELENLPGVRVIGRVDDVRPYIHFALAAVAPMRIARGIQNKVLESMAMARPIIVSPQGLEGLDVENQVLVAKKNEDYQQYIEGIISGQYLDLGEKARSVIQEHYSWEEALEPILKVLMPEQTVERSLQDAG